MLTASGLRRQEISRKQNTINECNADPSKDSTYKEAQESENGQTTYSPFQRWYMEEAGNESWTHLAALANGVTSERPIMGKEKGKAEKKMG
jgi:hypothetical protein